MEVLPATFLHGDVHGDNVIAPPTETTTTQAPAELASVKALAEATTAQAPAEVASVRVPAEVDLAGVPRLIDWGSVRVGPAMLDVMLGARRGGVAAYREAWAAASGTPMDGWELATGQAWATAVNNAMFVGVVAERSPESVELMLDEAEEAIGRLGKQLARRS